MKIFGWILLTVAGITLGLFVGRSIQHTLDRVDQVAASITNPYDFGEFSRRMFEGIPDKTLDALAAEADYQVAGREIPVMPADPAIFIVRACASYERERRALIKSLDKSITH